MSRQALPEPKWVDSRQNQFGITLLDLRSIASQSTAWSSSRDIIETYARLRRADGSGYVNKLPEDCVEVACNLSFAYSGVHGDGPIFKAQVMEDKWDMYVYVNQLYVSRSWTGELCFVAPCEFKPASVEIHRIFAVKRFVSDDPLYASRVVDYLIKSHMSNLAVPHPLPANLKDMPPGELAACSFEMFGRRGLFGSFEETIGIPGQPAGAPGGEKPGRG